ncbi:MAG: type IV pilus assembly protein PilM [Candidatus Aminicenantales bacterium]
MLGSRKEKNFVGLDIGSHGIKALELQSKKKGKKAYYEVSRIGYEPLSHDAIVEGTIIDSSAVVQTIKSLFDKNKFTNKNVVISISGNSVIIKKISLPSMETEELAESIIWEAKHNIPYPYEETNVDYAIFKPPRDSEAKGLEILLVAVKKDKVAAYSNVVHQARKNLEAIEVDAFALYNAMEINYPEEFEEKSIALINMGAHITTIIICEKGTPILFRDLSIGGSFFTENIRKDLNVSYEDAEKILKGIPVDNVQPYALETILTMNVKGLLDEIDKTFSFFESENKKEKKIEQIFLSGGLANLKNITSTFEQKFKFKTMIFDPFRNVFYNEKKLNPIYYQEMATFFGVAAGLATRGREK